MKSTPRPVLVLLAAALVCAGACTDELAKQRAAEQALVEPSAPTPRPQAPIYQPPRDPDFDPEAEAALKRSAAAAEGEVAPPAPQGGGTVIVAVDEAAAAAWPRVAASALPAQAREVLSGVALPVLVPDPQALTGGLSQSVATRGPWWYALSIHTGDGLTVQVIGRREAHIQPSLSDVELAPVLHDGRFLVSRSHSVVTVAWRAFGEVAYSIDVECARPMDDVRCTGDDFALELARGVLRVDEGGQP